LEDLLSLRRQILALIGSSSDNVGLEGGWIPTSGISKTSPLVEQEL
jgi:hypothetical protein